MPSHYPFGDENVALLSFPHEKRYQHSTGGKRVENQIWTSLLHCCQTQRGQQMPEKQTSLFMSQFFLVMELVFNFLGVLSPVVDS